MSGAAGPTVVLEIGSEWLKMLQVEASRGGVAVSRLHVQRFDPEAGDLAQSVAQAFRSRRFARSRVIACLPRQMVNIRMLELPSTDREEIADMVALQTGRQTPYSKEEIVSDYRISGSAREGYSKVMLAIVKRSVLRQRFSVLEEAGIDVVRMSVSTEGLLNWYACAVSGESTSAVLDVDASYSDFVVVSDGALLATRSILIGGEQLLGDPERWREKLAREVERSVETWRSESPDLTLRRLLVTGAAPNVEGLGAYLGGELDLPVTEVDSMNRVTRIPRAPDLRAGELRAVSLAPLVGIGCDPEALQFDLVPDSVRLRRGLVSKARSLTVLGMLLMSGLVLLSALAVLKLYARETRLREVERRVEATGPEAREVERMREITRIAARRAAPAFDTIGLLGEFHAAVPPDVYFTSLDLDAAEEKVRGAGSAGSRQLIRTLVRNLEQSARFANVEESGTSRTRNGRYTFQIVCELEKAE